MTFNEALAHDLRDTTTFFQGKFDAQSVTIVICCALALYNALMLLMLIFITFRKFKGLYFWSLVIASSGIMPYDIGFMIEYFQLTSQIAGVAITSIGWPMMVTGQSLVLYSRLGVVMGPQYRNILNGVRWMIIVDAVVLHVSTTVVVFGSYLAAPHHQFTLAYRYIEKIQMTGFTIQELILSGLYVWRTLEILKDSNPDRRRTKRIMWQLFSINVVIIVFDVALLVVEYQDRHVIEQALKQVIVKLKFEFAILSKLAGISRQGDQAFLGALEDYNESLDHDRAHSVHSVTTKGQASSHKTNSLQGHTSKQIGMSSSAFGEPKSTPAEHLEVAGVHTAIEQRNWRALQQDLYAGACRDLAI